MLWKQSRILSSSDFSSTRLPPYSFHKGGTKASLLPGNARCVAPSLQVISQVSVHLSCANGAKNATFSTHQGEKHAESHRGWWKPRCQRRPCNLPWPSWPLTRGMTSQLITPAEWYLEMKWPNPILNQGFWGVCEWPRMNSQFQHASTMIPSRISCSHPSAAALLSSLGANTRPNGQWTRSGTSERPATCWAVSAESNAVSLKITQ